MLLLLSCFPFSRVRIRWTGATSSRTKAAVGTNAAKDADGTEDQSPDFQMALAARRMSNMKNVFSSWVVVTERAADCKIVVEAVLKGMKKHMEVADVQRYGCKALENLAVRSMHQRVIVAKANAVQIMLKGMKAHGDDVEVQSFGCHALAVMSGNDLVMHEHITQMSGAIYMIDQLKIHSTSADFTANVCRLLANLSLHETVRAYLIKQQALTAIIRGIKEHSTDTDVNHFGFSALSNFANDTKLRPMIAKEITALVHKTLHVLHSDPDVQISGVTLLERISFNANQQVLVGERSVKLMVKVLSAHSDDAQAVMVAMTALSSLTRNAKNQDAAMAANADSLVVDRLKDYSANARICHFATGVLSNLVFKSTKYKAAVSKTGAVQAVIETMGTHLFEAAVQLAGVSFFRNFTASSEVHRTEVGRKGGILAIVDGLREHQTSKELYFQGCGALNNLCRDSLPLNKAAAKAARTSEVVGAVAETFEPTSPTRQAIMELIARLVK